MGGEGRVWEGGGGYRRGREGMGEGGYGRGRVWEREGMGGEGGYGRGREGEDMDAMHKVYCVSEY